MPKGVAQQSLANSGSGQGISNGAWANANSLYGTVAPALSAEAAHPGGYSPTQLANQNTAAQQSAGGSQAATVGQAGLMASRNRNAGSGVGAIANSQQNTGGLLSKAATGIQSKNADLEQKQQQSGLQGLQSLYGTSASTALGGLGASNQALSNADQADANNPWLKILQSGIAGASDVGGAYAGK